MTSPSPPTMEGTAHSPSSLPFSSRTIRPAVFFPTPGTLLNAVVSPAPTAMARASGEKRESTLSATRGPTPLIPISASKARRASSEWNPNSVMLSSRTWSEVNRTTSLPIGPRRSTVDAGTLARKVTPPTATSAQSTPTPSSVPLMDEISEETISETAFDVG